MNPVEKEIFRGKIGGKEKYCRILIRRKRAPLKEAIDYLEYSEQEQTELREQQACFVTALVSLKREAINGWEWDDRECVTPYCPHCGAKMDGGD